MVKVIRMGDVVLTIKDPPPFGVPFDGYSDGNGWEKAYEMLAIGIGIRYALDHVPYVLLWRP